jgi:predicted secreted protein
MSMDRITVAVNEEFTISLKSIATAGYLWKVESLPDAIQFLGTENEKPAGEIRPGDSTGQIFRFRADRTGEYKIKFALGRPWEDKAIESEEVTVKVV